MNTEKSFIKTEITNLENEITGDFILPDSFSDVKNILNARGRLKEIRKYFGANDAEISGSIVYDIMFTVQNAECKEEICSVSFIDDIKYNCRYKNPQNTGVGAQVKLRDVSCRMANPRKFTVKAMLETLLYEDISTRAYPSVSQVVPDDSEIQYKWGEIDQLRCKSASLCEHSFSDNIELDLKSPEIEKIVHSDVSINVRDARGNDINQTAVKLGGTLCLNLVYLDTAGDSHAVSREVGFGISVNDDESAMIGEIDQNTSIIPTVYISEINVNVGKNGYNETKVIEFDADYDIDLLFVSNEKAECVIDAYSTRFDTECKYEAYSYLKPVCRIRNNFTYSDSKEKGEYGIDNTSLFSSSIPVLSEINAQKIGQNMVLNGKLNNRLILADDEHRLKSKDISKSFGYKTNSDINADYVDLIGGVTVDNSRVRADNDRVYSDAEIYLNYLLASKESIRVCKNIIVGEKTCAKNDNELFCIYYHGENETLWDIAKDKKCTVESIRRLNPGIEASSCEVLIIE